MNCILCVNINIYLILSRMMPHELKAKMGVNECVKHGLMEPFQVLYEKEGKLVWF